MSTILPFVAPKPFEVQADRSMIVATLECFAPGQIVRVASHPSRLDGSNRGGLVLRRASIDEYVRENPDAENPRNSEIMKAANFYLVALSEEE